MALPNTLSIMQQIQLLINAQPNTAGYKTVALEAIKNWRGFDPVCEIAFIGDDSSHFAHGGKIEDVQRFRIATGVLYADDSDPTVTPLSVITKLTAIRDVVVPLFQQKAYLGGLIGVQDSRVREGSFRIGFLTVSGQDYLVHTFEVEVRSMYNITIPDGG
jgi:hypothetical protein